MIILHVAIFLVGSAFVALTLFSAIRTFVLPRNAPDALTRIVFLTVRRIFSLPMKFSHSYRERDRIMAFFAPVALLCLVPAWYVLIIIGYMGMYWATGTTQWSQAFIVSGSSLLTLGFSTPENSIQYALVFSQATLGLILVALLIAYLPTIYAAFSQRESAVTLLEVRAGAPPSAIEMIVRFNRIHGLHRLGEQWSAWET